MDILKIKTYQALILLNCMLTPDENGSVTTFKTILNGDDALLQPLFIDLLVKGYVTVVNNHYTVTDKGQAVYDTFNGRYREFLRVYDVYACVDGETGEFALDKFYDFRTDEEYDSYKSQLRFSDYRIRVAEFKGIDSHEIVFMSFLKDMRFDTTCTGWQIDLLSGSIWAEIDEICKSSVTLLEIGEGDINIGNEVMENMIRKGTDVMMNFMKNEIAFNKKRLAEIEAYAANVEEGSEEYEIVTTSTTIIEECEEDIVYYDRYYDPWYCSPIWVEPLFYW